VSRDAGHPERTTTMSTHPAHQDPPRQTEGAAPETRRRRSMLRRAALAATCLSGAAGLMLTAAGTASASIGHTPSWTQPHNECRAWVEENVRWPHPTQYRVAAECSYINPSEKARGTLDLTLLDDAHTEWFTNTGVIYHSGWRTPLFGVRGARMEYTPR
jgi:hypothetical protein